MIEIKTDIIKEFIYKKDYNYIIYIKETINKYESYLQNEDYGVISLMFGVNKHQTSLNAFISCINENIESYIYNYKELYEDKEG